jgi:dihydroorotase
MPENIDTITLRRAHDWHVRLSDGTMLATLMPDREGGR